MFSCGKLVQYKMAAPITNVGFKGENENVIDSNDAFFKVSAHSNAWMAEICVVEQQWALGQYLFHYFFYFHFSEHKSNVIFVNWR